MNQRFRVLQELGEQFQRASEAAEVGGSRSGNMTQPARAFVPRLHGPRPRRFWAVLGASGTALTVGIIAAVLLLSSGTPTAYAGWTSVPTSAPTAVSAAAAAVCNKLGASIAFGSSGPAGAPLLGRLERNAHTDVFTGQPVLTDTRGVYTAVIKVTNGMLYSCLTAEAQDTSGDRFHVNVWRFGPVRAAPGPDQISVPYQTRGGIGEGNGGDSPGEQLTDAAPAQQRAFVQRRRGGGYGPSMLGQTGSDVSAVTFTFANSQTVTATVENGWYFAWWPWADEPTSVAVVSRSGTVTSPVTSSQLGLDSLVPPCRTGSADCVFGSTTPAHSATTTATTP